MLNELQKNLYNMHLATTRSHQNKPFTIRKNFDDFETEKPEDYVNLLKIEQLVKSCNLNVKNYFKAPYQTYKDVEYFDLQFYTTQKAIKCYTIQINLLKSTLPDEKEQLTFIKDSLIFLKEYCIENNISLGSYFKQESGLSPTWATHLVTYKTSIYLIIGFELLGCNIYDMMHSMHPDDREMYLGNIQENYPKYRKHINESKIAKRLIVEGINKIDGIIKEKINKNEIKT